MAAEGLKYQYARLNIAEKLIVINVLVFVGMGLVKALISPGLDNWFALPTDFFDFLSQPWSIVTYSFLHGGIFHILWNMYILHVAARIMLNLFNEKRFLNVYFLGVILGGLLFLLSYNVFPELIAINTSLIGASAGVMAVLIFVCTYIPNQEVRLFFFNVKLWHIGVFVVLMDLVMLPLGNNAGGRIAHLGGAFLGYMYARQLFQGHDIGSGFSDFLDSIVNLFKGKQKKGPLKTVYKKQNSATRKSKSNYEKGSHQKQIDAILDKISKSGYESLSQAEKDFLFKAGK
jgi:membrane associated rhomboid family serine protease